MRNNWSIELLSDLSTSIDYGHTASATIENTKTKFLRITDIQDNFVNWENVPFCICSELEGKRYELADGDIVFARTGATTGKSYLINNCPPKSVFASYLIRVRPNDKINPKYLFQYFQTSGYWKQISSRATGTAQAGVNASKLASLKIPLPPLDEQKRIAAVLDRADALREKRRRTLGRLDALLQSVFLEMFGNGKFIPFVNVTGEPRENPNNWRWEKLTAVARLATGHTPSRKIPEYWGGNIPWITLTDIRKLDGQIAYETSEYTNDLGIKKSSAVLLPEKTVCLSRTASVGFVTMMGRKMATSQDFVNWVCGEDLNPTYLMWALIYSRNSIKSLSSGTTHKTIYFPTVEDFHALIPPINLQEKFETIANQVAKHRGNLELSVTKLENLFQSLQQKAFKGELWK